MALMTCLLPARSCKQLADQPIPIGLKPRKLQTALLPLT